MQKRVLCALACGVAAISAYPAVTATNTWNYSANTANTSPATAADWFNADNWAKSPVPNGAQWRAVLTGVPSGVRYISISDALSLGSFAGHDITSPSVGVVLFGDHPITFDNAGARCYVRGGRLYADATAPSKQELGSDHNIEFDGRIDISALFVLASGAAYQRLDRYATSSDPVRTDDFKATGIYRGSGGMYFIGPGKGTAHSGTWTVTAGSPFVTRVQTTPVIAPGAVVTCGDVFPEGTFVKRVFSDTWIELSSAASAGATSGDMELSFAAISPKATITIPDLRMATYVTTYTAFAQPDKDGDFRVVASNLVATSSAYGPIPFLPHVANTFGYPATIVIHDAAWSSSGYHQNAKCLLFLMGECHIEFAETGRTGARSGIPQGTATSYVKNTTTRITVTNGIDAAIGLVTNFYNTIVKDGAGSLELGLTNNVAKNTGKIVVAEGSVVLPEGSWVKTVAISNGASLKIDGTFEPETFISEPGAKICGNGTLVLPDVSYMSDLVFEDDAKVKFKTNTGDGFVRNVPEYRVVGIPAFWVDASQVSTMTFKDDDGVNIARVNDVRKTSEDDGYLFATNHTLYPTLAKNGDGSANNIDFGARNASATMIEQVRDLFWSEPITNIWAIFMVQDTSRGGGQFLGSSARLKAAAGRSTSDFVRDASTSWAGPVFHTGNSGTYQKALINGLFYCNGILRHPFSGYSYVGGSCGMNGGSDRYTPHVSEAYPLLPVAADCFAFDSGLANRNGNKRVCEMIIYTNKLTQAERLAVCGYLMDKWLGCDVTCDVQTNLVKSVSLASDPPGFVVDDGELLYAGNVSGSGRFAKSGNGTMYVDYLDGHSANVVVSEGVLEVNSCSVPAADDIPSDGLLFRMDATRRDLMRTTEENGVERIERWFSAHDGNTRWAKYAYGGTDSSTNSAIYRANMLNGNAMLDFGTAFMKSVNKSISGMQYNRVTIRSVFMVQNTSNGGAVLVGDTSTWSKGGIMRNGWYLGNATGGGYLLGDFSDWSNVLVMNGSGRFDVLEAPGGSRTRLNGEWICPGTSGYSGGNDLLSFVSYLPITSDAYGYSNGYGVYCGGGMLGEYIAYSRGLSDRDALKVEAYLRKKWFNADTPGFTPAVASNLTIAAGATLNISGGAPMTVKGTFSGGGTVSGALALAADAVIEVPVAPNDTIQPVTISGTVDLSNGGTVRLVGDARRLRGDYTLVSCPSLTAASAGAWTVEFVGARDSACKYIAFATDGAFVLRVMPPGITISFR